MLERVFLFGDRKISEVKVSINKVFTVQEKSMISDVCETVYKKGYSRIPVIHDNRSFFGVLYTKNLTCPDKNISVKKLLGKPHFMGIETDIMDAF